MPATTDQFDKWFLPQWNAHMDHVLAEKAFRAGYAACEVAAQQVAEADRAGRAEQARSWVEKIHKASADVLHEHEEGQDVELVALTIFDWAQRALAALGPAA
jgi:hypothetical protein